MMKPMPASLIAGSLAYVIVRALRRDEDAPPSPRRLDEIEPPLVGLARQVA